jgi:hypothetical protein
MAIGIKTALVEPPSTANAGSGDTAAIAGSVATILRTISSGSDILSTLSDRRLALRALQARRAPGTTNADVPAKRHKTHIARTIKACIFQSGCEVDCR